MVDILILITDKSWKNLSHHGNQSSVTTGAISITTVAILSSSCVKHLYCKTGPMQANSCEEPCARQYPNHHYSFLPPCQLYWEVQDSLHKIISMDRACLKLKHTQDKNLSSWEWQLLACCT
ncbi:hypothetical protein MRB53_018744 [Persea americana]|uniref:Uncharacterized protein n=1 Tax=Persea americana TaxID=3435 RepID=A0ACC2M8R4_PERAE|nr:hypothetical protein MRB53_018744 [Persea americana]